jgi:ATP-binding protein involved in chromosome partitioning
MRRSTAPRSARLLATEGRKPEAESQKIHPVQSPSGVPMSRWATSSQPGQAIAWRGPMAGNALGELIDARMGRCRDHRGRNLPPARATLRLDHAPEAPPAGAVIVSTAQDLALMDAARADPAVRAGRRAADRHGREHGRLTSRTRIAAKAAIPFGQGGAEAAAKTMGLAVPWPGAAEPCSIRQSQRCG